MILKIIGAIIAIGAILYMGYLIIEMFKEF